MDDASLLARALEARAKAYAPYSRFAVGAAILARSGKVYLGVNVENASYGATVCAERAALFAAVTAGERSFEAIAVAAETKEPVRPCGICRQAIAEFGMDVRVIMGNLSGAMETKPLAALLPLEFRSRNREEGR